MVLQMEEQKPAYSDVVCSNASFFGKKWYETDILASHALLILPNFARLTKRSYQKISDLRYATAPCVRILFGTNRQFRTASEDYHLSPHRLL